MSPTNEQAKQCEAVIASLENASGAGHPPAVRKEIEFLLDDVSRILRGEAHFSLLRRCINEASPTVQGYLAY